MSELVPVVIPSNIENLKLPDPDLLYQYIDLKNRTIWISDDISIYTLSVVQSIIYWNRADEDIPVEERKPIKLLFFTNGGDLEVYYTVRDVISISKTPVYGINMGKCASAGAFIFLACHKRYMLKNSYFLIHKGSAYMGGNFNEFISMVANYQQQVDLLVNDVVGATEFTEEEMAEYMNTDFYITKELAIEKGVVDGVIDDISYLL